MVNNTGGGAITMSNFTTNRILGSSSLGSLVNDTSDTIQGSGQIGAGTQLALNNKGLIDANQSNSLTINPIAGVTNTGTLRASAGGMLNLPATINNTGGTILSTGTNSVVNLSGGTITGGTLTTASGGAMFSGNSTLNGVTISTGSMVTAQDHSTTTLKGTITNNGTFLLNSGGAVTDVFINGTVNNTAPSAPSA